MSVAMTVGDGLAFEKTVIEPGSGVCVPIEFSQCQITLHCCSSPLPLDINDVIGYDLDEQIEVVIGHGKTSAACVIDACIQTMKNGETCLMSTVAASGENGLSCRLEFQITLLSYTDASEVHRLSAAEKFARASLLKEIGSEAFRSGDISAAFYKFSRAYKYLLCISTTELAVVGSDSLDETATPSSTISTTNGCCSVTSTDTYNELLCQCLLNLAACQLRRDNFELAKANCTKALALDPRNVKGLFRRAKCYIHLGEEHLAVTDLQLASELDPGNREIIKLFRTAQDMSRKTDEKLSRALGKMFQHT